MSQKALWKWAKAQFQLVKAWMQGTIGIILSKKQGCAAVGNAELEIRR
ncbi:hypothetical protein GcM1_175003 [Golovinomyces cichoracearum]|uniref:Uncharacterized protein n=1 Tax=Golovinomyces cichoracearum TaxID=62708 RepID=A0A420J5G1_9PEZI|nr:hypothetical protein GcM1_175003 [Golovinomyces cichoracearum]